MDGGKNPIDSLATMVPTSASSSTHSLQVPPEPSRKNDEAEARQPTIGFRRRPRPLNLKMDPRKLRRILSNRASADKARVKQSQHIYEMETKAKALEANVKMLLPQVGFYQRQQEMLLMERESMKRRISDYASYKHHKEAEIEDKRFWLGKLKLTQGKQREITQGQAPYKGKMVSYGDTNNPAQIGKNTGEVTSKLSNTEVKQGNKEGHTRMWTPWIPMMVPTPTLSMDRRSKPQPKANSKSKDPLSLSLGINANTDYHYGSSV